MKATMSATSASLRLFAGILSVYPSTSSADGSAISAGEVRVVGRHGGTVDQQHLGTGETDPPGPGAATEVLAVAAGAPLALRQLLAVLSSRGQLRTTRRGVGVGVVSTGGAEHHRCRDPAGESEPTESRTEAFGDRHPEMVGVVS